MKFHNIIWDDDEYYSEEVEEIPCDRCGRLFPENALQSYEDYNRCCWDCSCHLEDPKGYPFDPKNEIPIGYYKCEKCGMLLELGSGWQPHSCMKG